MRFPSCTLLGRTLEDRSKYTPAACWAKGNR